MEILTYKWFTHLFRENKYEEICQICLNDIATIKTPFAYTCLGMMADSGYGIDDDIHKASDYIKMGIELKDPFAFLHIGRIYKEHGKYKKAIKYYLLADKIVPGIAGASIGSMYSQGLGVKQNFIKALKWYNKIDIKYEHLAYKLWLKGMIYYKLGDYIIALHHLYQAQLEYDKLGYESDIIDCVGMINEISKIQDALAEVLTKLVDDKIIKQNEVDTKHNKITSTYVSTIQLYYKTMETHQADYLKYDECAMRMNKLFHKPNVIDRILYLLFSDPLIELTDVKICTKPIDTNDDDNDIDIDIASVII